MNHTLDIDGIVREVLRRLADHTAAPRAAGSSLELADRVLTLDTLSRLPKDVRAVRIAPGSIITPAARDELKRRSIQIERVTSSAAEKGQVANVALWLETGVAIPEGAAAAWRNASQGGPREILGRIGESLQRGGQAIVAARAAHAAAIALNRKPGVRAAVVEAAERIEEIIAHSGANVLVLEAGKAPASLWNRLLELSPAAAPPRADWPAT